MHTVHKYPPSRFEYVPITDTQIEQAISWLGLYKAPGADGISNVVLIKCADLIVPHLGPNYHVMFKLETYPENWKSSVTIMLRKLAKPDYMLPSTHQPIALISTFTKVLSSCVTADLVHMTKVHRLLPDNYFGCRPGRTTTDLLHYITKFIKDAWGRCEVVSMLFLDVKAAFPSIILDQLIHDMRKRGVPPQ